MSLREKLWDYSCGNGLGLFWRMFLLRQRTKSRLGAVYSASLSIAAPAGTEAMSVSGHRLLPSPLCPMAYTGYTYPALPP